MGAEEIKKHRTLHRQKSKDSTKETTMAEYNIKKHRTLHRQRSKNSNKETDSVDGLDNSPKTLRRQKSKSSIKETDSTEGQITSPKALRRQKSRQSLTPVSQALDNLNLSFAGGGFLGIYHLAVATGLARHGPTFLARVKRFAGASAGSLVALALTIFGSDEEVLSQCAEFAYGLACEVHKQPLGALTPKVSLLAPLEQFIERVLPADAHQVATGKLYVSVTKKRKNLLVSEFHSREELIKYILASCYIPGITGSEPIHINNESYTDGGFTENLPVLPEGRTITVSPLAGRQDICPADVGRGLGRGGKYVYTHNQRVRVNKRNIVRSVHAFAPPRQEKLERYFTQGLLDATRFLRRLGFYEEGMLDEETPLCVMEDEAGTEWYCTQL